MVATVVYVIAKYGTLPDKIPAHYNYAGEIDRWGNKAEVFISLIVQVLMYLPLSVINLIPNIWVKGIIKSKNQSQAITQIKISNEMIAIIKLEMVVTYVYITYNTVNSMNLLSLLCPIILVVTFVTIFYYLIKFFRSNK